MSTTVPQKTKTPCTQCREREATAKGLCGRCYQRSRRSETGLPRQPKVLTEGEKGVTLAFVLPKTSDARLREHAKNRGVSVGVVIREALHAYLTEPDQSA